MSKVKLVFAVCSKDLFYAGDFHFGNKGGLPWGHVKEELAHFKKETKDTVLVMGSNTFLSLPGKLPGRTHAVLSHKGEQLITKDGKSADIVFKGGNLSGTIDVLKNMYPEKDISIIGGKMLIEEAIRFKLVDEIVVSYIVPRENAEIIESDVVITKETMNMEGYEMILNFSETGKCIDNKNIAGFFVERLIKK